jgi:DMSO/TMAO reductase YedYZ molybdopterin-dependent catalytic subunit
VSADPTERETLRIDGTEPVVLPWDVRPEQTGFEVVRDTIGFECASGDWLESDWVGVPVLDLVEAASPPSETTHFQFESAGGDTACVPLTDLEGGIIALSDGAGSAPGRPRLVSPHVLGPRTVKSLRRIRPLALDPGAQREDYESLPIDE